MEVRAGLMHIHIRQFWGHNALDLDKITNLLARQGNMRFRMATKDAGPTERRDLAQYIYTTPDHWRCLWYDVLERDVGNPIATAARPFR